MFSFLAQSSTESSDLEIFLIFAIVALVYGVWRWRTRFNRMSESEIRAAVRRKERLVAWLKDPGKRVREERERKRKELEKRRISRERARERAQERKSERINQRIRKIERIKQRISNFFDWSETGFTIWLFSRLWTLGKWYLWFIGFALVLGFSVYFGRLAIKEIYIRDQWELPVACTILLVMWGWYALKKNEEMNKLRSELNNEIKRLEKVLNENGKQRYRAIRKFQKDKGIKLTYDEEQYLLMGDRSQEEAE